MLTGVCSITQKAQKCAFLLNHLVKNSTLDPHFFSIVYKIIQRTDVKPLPHNSSFLPHHLLFVSKKIYDDKLIKDCFVKTKKKDHPDYIQQQQDLEIKCSVI